MDQHPHDDPTATALRELDPSPRAELTAAERRRADDTFARIVATAPDAGPDAGPVATPPRRRRRLLAAGAALAAALVAVPALLLGGSPAFASWTPSPEPLSRSAADTAARTCLVALEVPAAAGERVVLAERRGGWTYVLLEGGTTESSCLLPDGAVGSSDPSVARERGFFGSHDTDVPALPVPAPGMLDETGSMTGGVPSGRPWLLGGREEWFTSVQGVVGEDVTAVTVHPPTGRDVEASLARGRFAAWWPTPRPDKDPAASAAWSYTLTLADGSTRRVGG